MIRRMIMLAALLLAAPVPAQTISGCGTTVIAKTSLNSSAKLTTEATCFGKARDTAAGAVGARSARIAQLAATPVVTPVVTPPVSSAPKLAIGTNLAVIGSRSAETPFIDRFKMNAGWVTNTNNTWTGDATPDMIGTNGYPQVAPPGVRFVTGAPLDVGAGTHRYVLTYAGTGSFFLDGVTIVSTAPGRIVFDGGTNGLLVYLTEGSGTDLVHDMHIMRLDQEAAFAAGAIFNPDFIALAKHFSALRMMDWGKTNGSQTVTWSQRAHLTDFSWGVVPLEVQIAAANAANADLWACIPAHADDDYIRQAATMIRDQLAPGLVAHLEYSNEIWNNSFEQSNWAQTQADALWGADSPQYAGRMQWSGYRTAQMARIAHDVFGADADKRLSVVLATFLYGDQTVTDQITKGVGKANVGTIPSLFKEYAITTYFGDQLGASPDPSGAADAAKVVGWATDPAGLDNAFKELAVGGQLSGNASLAVLRKVYVTQAAQAKAWGLKLVAYEGGPSWYYFAAPDKAPYDSLLGRVLADPRMGTLTTQMAQDFGAAGGTLLMHYTDIGAPTMWGPWGAQPDLYTQTPRSKALIDASRR